MIDEQEKEKRERYEKNLMRDLKLLIPYLEDKNITDIFVLGNGDIKITVFGEGSKYTGENLSIEQRMRIIFAISSIINKPAEKIFYGVIPKYNARFTAIMPHLVQAAEFTIRRPPEKIFSLEDYLEKKQITQEQYNQVCTAIEMRKNIIVGGSTGSGKTTFLNAILKKMAELTPDERFLVIEDTPELRSSAKDTTYACGNSEEVIDIVRFAMRWTMKRIIFGELRSGDVANELIKIWRSGHTGNATTIHAGSAAEVFVRLNGLLGEVITGQLPRLSESIQVCVHLIRGNSGPKVNEVLFTEEAGIDDYINMLSSGK